MSPRGRPGGWGLRRGVIRNGDIGVLLVVQPGGEVGRGFGAARFGVQLGQGRFGGLSRGLLRGLGVFGFRGPAGLFGFGGLGLLRIGLVRSRGGDAAEEDEGGAKGAGGRGGVCRCES